MNDSSFGIKYQVMVRGDDLKIRHSRDRFDFIASQPQTLTNGLEVSSSLIQSTRQIGSLRNAKHRPAPKRGRWLPILAEQSSSPDSLRQVRRE